MTDVIESNHTQTADRRPSKTKNRSTMLSGRFANRSQILSTFASLAIVGSGLAAPTLTAAESTIICESYDPKIGFSIRARLPDDLPSSGSILSEMKDADGALLLRLSIDGEQLVLATWTQPPPQSKINQQAAKHPTKAGSQSERLRQGRLDLGIPLSLLTKSQQRDLTLVVTPARLSLYLNGVLINEEWPLGLMQFKTPISLNSANGATVTSSEATPSSGKVAQINGGAAQVKENWNRLLSDTGSAPPYFRPFGINTHAGDNMPFYHEGRWHLFYLFDRRNHTSKFGYGGFEWGHISTTDLVKWQEHPTAIGITDPWDSIITGSVIHSGEEYLAFYNTNLSPETLGRSGSSQNAGRGVRVARSTDGFNFTRDPVPVPHVLSFGDPDVFRMDDGRYGMLSRGDEKGQRKIAFHTSLDLKTWQREDHSPIAFAPDNCDCPHYFTFRGTSYLFASKVARKANSLNGPWMDIPKSTLGVPKTAMWKDGRRLISGTVSDGGWGGDAILHELVQLPGELLGEKFVDELTPLRGEPIKVHIVPLFGNAQPGKDHVTLKGAAGFSAVAIDEIPEKARIRLSIKASQDCRRFGIGARGKGAYEAGSVLLFKPTEKAAVYGSILGPDKHNEIREIKEVGGIDQLIAVDLILGPNGIVDLEINNQRCLTGRGSANADFRRCFLFSEGGEVLFENIEVLPWEPNATMEAITHSK